MPNVPQVSWSESDPQGSENIALGDNRIRELKTQVREVIAVDHEFALSGQTATTGQHYRVTLQEQANLGTGAVGTTILGSQTVSGKGELVYTDEDNTDVQITSSGFIRAASLSTVPIAQGGTGVTTLAALGSLFFPIGSVLTFGVSTNPNTLLGFGTWTAIAGRVIVGIDAGQTEFDTLDETGGAKTVDISHTHPINSAAGAYGDGGAVDGGISRSGTEFSNKVSGNTITTSSSGSTTTSVLQPYIVKYVWQRTA